MSFITHESEALLKDLPQPGSRHWGNVEVPSNELLFMGTWIIHDRGNEVSQNRLVAGQEYLLRLIRWKQIGTLVSLQYLARRTPQRHGWTLFDVRSLWFHRGPPYDMQLVVEVEEYRWYVLPANKWLKDVPAFAQPIWSEPGVREKKK